MSHKIYSNENLDRDAKTQVLRFFRSDASLASLLFVVLGILSAADMVSDVADGASWEHLIFEIFILIFSILAMGYFLFRSRSLHRALDAERRIRANIETEATKLRSTNLRIAEDFSETIEKQFSEWSLSPAERDVALFILKGMTLTEISDLRKTSEKTIKQQCGHIYSKSRLAGRAELSAFFLEEILNRS